jgi:hypothetical protein
MAAMDDLVTDINRRAVLLERQIHDVDRPINAGAKSAGIGKIDFHSRRSSSAKLYQVFRSLQPTSKVHDTSDKQVPSTELATPTPATPRKRKSADKSNTVQQVIPSSDWTNPRCCVLLLPDDIVTDLSKLNHSADSGRMDQNEDLLNTMLVEPSSKQLATI